MIQFSIASKMASTGTSLAIQQLRLHASTAGSAGSTPGRELRPRMPRGAAEKKEKIASTYKYS